MGISGTLHDNPFKSPGRGAAVLAGHFVFVEIQES